MKKLLLASTALVLSAGVAAADVAVGGDGRMGVQDGFGDDDLRFTSRIRISFSASGETDGGLSFGGSIRADNAGEFNIVDGDGNSLGDGGFDINNDPSFDGGGGVNGADGSVFIEGAFGRLTMGDVDSAAENAVGDLSGVGLTGLGDLNEATYIAGSDSAGASEPAALYEYSAAGFTGYLSVTNPGNPVTGADADATPWSIGATYSFGDFSVLAGYEDNDQGTDHIIVGGTAAFAGATLKAYFGTASGDIDGDQYGVSVDYTFDAITGTLFYNDREELGGAEAYGVGASYDLGGGASLKAGFAQNETADDSAYDFGISFSF